MKHELGWYFPDGEKHLPDWMRKAKQERDGVLQYQFHKYEAALKLVKQHRVAVDIGAHIGQWSRNMSVDFAEVHAFEPVPQYAICWRRNMEEVNNATLHLMALGEKTGKVSLSCGTPGSHGDTFIANGKGNAANHVPMMTLDLMNLHMVDFLKIDAEGYEKFIILGGEGTIRYNKPCIIVEQKPGMAQKYGLGETDAVALLESWGAKRRAEISGDFILSW